MNSILTSLLNLVSIISPVIVFGTCCYFLAKKTSVEAILMIIGSGIGRKSSLKEFAFSCPQRKAAYQAMAGNDEMAQLAQCVKCMFANFDGTPDLNTGELVPEYVECRKRHYCAHVGVGCMPTKKAIELSDRENSLLPYLHLPNDQIAEKTFISVHTVKTHIRNIGKKLNLSKKPAMVKWASENVLIN